MKDLFNANLVCRTWYWRLWRETEQRELWIPRICNFLDNDRLKVQRYARIMHDLKFRGMLRGETVEDCVTTIALIQRTESEFVVTQAHGIFQADLVSNLFSYRVEALIGSTHFEMKVDSALFEIFYSIWGWTIIRCYYGDYEKGNGHRLDEGKIVYSGGFQQKKRHGQGISYHNNGEKEFVGTFVDDDPQEGKKFRKNGTLLFEGEMDGNMFYRGSLYNHIGQLSFKGMFTNGACIAGTWFNSNGIIHTGHANDFPPISAFPLYQTEKCTFSLTSKTYIKQRWYKCRTCFGETFDGVCVTCASKCHKGHVLEEQNSEEFVCHCVAGLGNCVCN